MDAKRGRKIEGTRGQPYSKWEIGRRYFVTKPAVYEVGSKFKRPVIAATDAENNTTWLMPVTSDLEDKLAQIEAGTPVEVVPVDKRDIGGGKTYVVFDVWEVQEKLPFDD